MAMLKRVCHEETEIYYSWPLGRATCISWNPNLHNTLQKKTDRNTAEMYKSQNKFRIWTDEYHLKVGNGERFLKDICSISSTSQGTQCGQVAAITSHRLDNKYTVFGARSRLLDTVNNLQATKETNSQTYMTNKKGFLLVMASGNSTNYF